MLGDILPAILGAMLEAILEAILGTILGAKTFYTHLPKKLMVFHYQKDHLN